MAEQDVQINDLVAEEPLFRFKNPACYICYGFYGPCLEDPVCSMCHDFLFPKIPLIIRTDSRYYEEEDVSSLADCISQFHLHGARDMHMNRIVEPQPVVDFNIDVLPPEVLMQVFDYLDDISLWTVGQVSVRWNQILHISQKQWHAYTIKRWPLLNRLNKDESWFNIYSTMMNSCSCTTCIKQMDSHPQEFLNLYDNSWRNVRLRNELRSLELPDGIKVTSLNNLGLHWQAVMPGPAGTSYEGGLFFLHIQIIHTYPARPPIVRFLTKIFHPNISRHGDIGIDILRHNWSPSLTLGKICMEPEVGALYVRDRASYERQVRLWTRKYAMT